jgi:NAD(P)-dependent dehydrogenase (short-subunit alcohol dehydrogenase family)
MSQQDTREQQQARSPRKWGAADIPDQTGRTAVITGANSGIGREAARYLAARGARVVLACRDEDKARAVAAEIAGELGAEADTVALDLSSLESVRAAAAELRSRYPRLDLLVNNAGVMMPPLGRTADGFELQLGTNHLGHFALTGLVLPSLLEVPGSRVVTVSSNGHRAGRINFDDLQWESHRYRRMGAYGQSKLANLLFTYELQRRLAAAGDPTIAVAAHPGFSDTALTRYMPAWMQLGARLAPSQGATMGALPTVRAATDPAAAGGDYYGPAGLGEMTGPPKRVGSSARSRDEAAARRLWTVSEELTGVTFTP